MDVFRRGQSVITDLDFADDIVLFDLSSCYKKVWRCLLKKTMRLGLILSLDKTEILAPDYLPKPSEYKGVLFKWSESSNIWDPWCQEMHHAKPKSREESITVR